jgi:hypothetical protein
VSCDWNTEVTCWDDATQTDFCAEFQEGCPCADWQVKCTNQWGAWCQDPQWGDCPEPPPVCTDTQMMCWNHETWKDECHEQADGCPCQSENEATCYDHVYGYAWCQHSDWGPCPVFCETDEVWCWEEGATTNTCHPMADGCPCQAHELKCEDPNWGPWCQDPMWGTCPVICNWNTEVHCWDEETSAESCHPQDQGCPGECPDGEITCHVCTWDEPIPQPEPEPSTGGR